MFHLCFPVHYLPLCNASISCKEVEVKREKKKLGREVGNHIQAAFLSFVN